MNKKTINSVENNISVSLLVLFYLRGVIICPSLYVQQHDVVVMEFLLLQLAKYLL